MNTKHGLWRVLDHELELNKLGTWNRLLLGTLQGVFLLFSCIPEDLMRALESFATRAKEALGDAEV
ncbi:MAG: hypothetical protein QW579_02425, partial [Desulfurococcaceae archaeon]